MPVLTALLLYEERREAQTAYQAQLLWQLNAQVYALLSGEGYAMPNYFELFPLRQTGASAEQIRSQVLHDLKETEGEEDESCRI